MPYVLLDDEIDILVDYLKFQQAGTSLYHLADHLEAHCPEFCGYPSDKFLSNMLSKGQPYGMSVFDELPSNMLSEGQPEGTSVFDCWSEPDQGIFDLHLPVQLGSAVSPLIS
jgi:hypothetical protein